MRLILDIFNELDCIGSRLTSHDPFARDLMEFQEDLEVQLVAGQKFFFVALIARICVVEEVVDISELCDQ